MRSRGFSIAEFVISITILLIVSVAVLPMLLKKGKMPTEYGKKDGFYNCSCKADNSAKTCTFKTAEQPNIKEFVTINMVGGGAGGSSAAHGKGGAAGEVRTVHYPAMKGVFEIELGIGGAKGKNGGDTILKFNDEIIEVAKGGVSNNETTTLKEEMYGESSPIQATDEPCGKGGDAGEQGHQGEVIIRW